MEVDGAQFKRLPEKSDESVAIVRAGDDVGSRSVVAQDAAKVAAKPHGHVAIASGGRCSYRIGPQDVLRLTCGKKRRFEISSRRPAEKFLPLLNDVQAAGLTAMELAQTTSRRMKKFITSPQ